MQRRTGRVLTQNPEPANRKPAISPFWKVDPFSRDHAAAHTNPVDGKSPFEAGVQRSGIRYVTAGGLQGSMTRSDS